MAVVTKYGSGFPAPTSPTAIDHIFAEGNARAINSKISIANGDSALSLFYIGRVPSQAIIDPRSTYYYEAITGVTDFDVGFYDKDGVVIDADALIDGDDIHLAGNQTLAGHGTITTPNMNMRAWQWAGLSADPGAMLSIVGTLKAASTADGVVQFYFDFSK